MNLYGNSLKYTKHGYITVSLRVIEEKPPLPSSLAAHTQPLPQSAVRLTVSDTGQGISPVFLRTKIFTAFAQEDTKASGSGLGLSIVKSLVSKLGGEIDIKSVLNVGTIVTVNCRKLTIPRDDIDLVNIASSDETKRSIEPGTLTKVRSHAAASLERPKCARFEKAATSTTVCHL